jgi:hypothetical protein
LIADSSDGWHIRGGDSEPFDRQEGAASRIAGIDDRHPVGWPAAGCVAIERRGGQSVCIDGSLWFYDGVDEFLQDGEHIPASISTYTMGLVDQTAHPAIEFGLGGRHHALFLILPEEQFPCDAFFLMANKSFHDTPPI